MTVFAQTFGATGPELAFLHGWGLHSGVWSGVCDALSHNHKVTLIDLPGHGRSPPLPGTCTLEAITASVVEAVAPGAICVGWSLGGMVALDLATRLPERVHKLVLVASNPRYVRSPDWPWAMDSDTLEQFGVELERNYAATLGRFLALQVLGDVAGRRTLRHLQDALAAYPPHPDALRCGLALLRDQDLRPRLSAVTCPTLLIYGGRDVIVPAPVGDKLAELIPTAHLSSIEHAGHAPFISNPREFIDAIGQFIQDGT